MSKIKTIFLLLIILRNTQTLFSQVSGLQNIIKYIDSNDYGNQKQYSFLSPIVTNVDIMMLGESIHLTREFPLVRIGMIKYLNENHNFNLVAMEGGVADVWVAQDILFSSVKNVTTPTMVLTGEADYRTPMPASEQYYAALQLLGVESVLVRVPDEPHGISVCPSHHISKLQYIMGWINKYNN